MTPERFAKEKFPMGNVCYSTWHLSRHSSKEYDAASIWGSRKAEALSYKLVEPTLTTVWRWLPVVQGDSLQRELSHEEHLQMLMLHQQPRNSTKPFTPPPS